MPWIEDSQPREKGVEVRQPVKEVYVESLDTASVLEDLRHFILDLHGKVPMELKIPLEVVVKEVLRVERKVITKDVQEANHG